MIPVKSSGYPMNKDCLLSLLACLRALSILHQDAHWNVGGNSYYGDHILLQRLYEDTLGGEIDTLAEKIVGTYGAGCINAVHHVAMANQFIVRWCRESNLITRSLLAEGDLQVELRKCFDALESSRAMSLGMEDFLAATASSHETAIYLLRQRSAI